MERPTWQKGDRVEFDWPAHGTTRGEVVGFTAGKATPRLIVEVRRIGGLPLARPLRTHVGYTVARRV